MTQQTPGQPDPYDQTRITSSNPPPVNPIPGTPRPEESPPAGIDHSAAGAEPTRPPQHGGPPQGQYGQEQYGQGQYGQGQYGQWQPGAAQPGQYGGQQPPQQYGSPSNQPQYGAPQGQPQYGAPQGQPHYGGQAPYQQGGQQPYQAGQNPYGAPQSNQGQQPYGSAFGAAPATSTEPVSQAVKIIGLVIGVFAVLVAIAAFLPWISGTISESGLGGDGDGSNDGVLTLVLAVIAGIFGVVSVLINKRSALHLTAGIVAVVTGLLVALIAIIDIADVMDAKDTGEVLGITVDVGIGLWLTLVGGIGLVIAGIAGIIKRK
ncbi:hypothetical protein [Williamsia limnetica]|nr:hypothetical protein [Williamsia limnetica]